MLGLPGGANVNRCLRLERDGGHYRRAQYSNEQGYSRDDHPPGRLSNEQRAAAGAIHALPIWKFGRIA